MIEVIKGHATSYKAVIINWFNISFSIDVGDGYTLMSNSLAIEGFMTTALERIVIVDVMADYSSNTPVLARLQTDSSTNGDKMNTQENCGKQ